MRRLLALAFVLVVALVVGFGALAADVTVTYLGHSCFTIQEEGGPIIMIDPYSTYVPYPALPEPADIVLISHAHVDHDPASMGQFDRVQGDPEYVRKLGSNGRCQERIPPATWSITDDFETSVVQGNHVNARGGGEGYVCMYTFVIGGIRFAHLGDLGRTLDARQIAAFSEVDVLFIPVDGAFTLNASEALTVISQIPSLKIAIPMHYRVLGITPWTNMATLSRFTSAAGAVHTVVETGESSIVLNIDGLPATTEIWTMDYARP